MNERERQPAATSTNVAWGGPISEERQAELQRYLDNWQAETEHGQRRGPFDGEPGGDGVYLTGADVYWLASQTPPPTPSDGIVLGGTIPIRSELHLEGANLRQAHLENASLHSVHLEGAVLCMAHLQGATLSLAHLEKANAWLANMDGASLLHAHLNGAILIGCRLRGARLNGAHLEGAQLSNALFNQDTHLNDAHLQGAWLDQVDFGGASLTTVNWGEVRYLGEEAWAHWHIDQNGNEKDRPTRIADHQTAIRANRQLATSLQNQGLGEHADRFAYRAQVVQRHLLWIEAGLPLRLVGVWSLGVEEIKQRLPQVVRFLGKVWGVGRWLFSLALGTLAGYGYKPGRTLFWYLVVIFGFAFAYAQWGHVSGHPFTFDEALVFSVTSFHGRGFFPGSLSLKDIVTRLAAAEAVIGLVIEISFIATFTRRFFAR